jgi:sRNA-binding protein
LAIGIDREILAALPGTNLIVLGAVLRAHCSGSGCLTHLAAGEPRRHLDGSSAGSPTPKDAEGAAARLKGLARRKAQRTKSGGGATARPAVPTRQ